MKLWCGPGTENSDTTVNPERNIESPNMKVTPVNFD